ncbi:hypothetical protein DFJ43DRAFT_990366 [Lentinula guzmanii]|uniref:Uncharacterized protein n=3 Tax=Lentinula TaxID=5352 RepID=A0AA38JGW9_9AGAR|nr:hypothetical protein DFJ43DRAFT_1003479 [Lentinula guzmanii]KAJ3742743.1 hypothetical protein DFH05DRAFT_1449616 [Lentinula detonsa]KAJ3780656.1 hypothetical protein GGU10DRAFT_278989 [Lentinula aff. detonsa]KAJ3731143.1 hypothetical protein DFJ43DRAFT_999857 [Lentinula guzmanii]KAJ3736238.1 hypothetical protein DFJ43DRAFT_990366 [Lentinula guzmanii]
MVTFSRQSGDQDLEEFWSYCLQALDVLRHDGMSDEEDAKENIVTGGLETTRKVRLVKTLHWRHESFKPLFEHIDKAKDVEELIFTQVGRGRLPRKRVDVVSKRDPPVGLPRSIFRQGYLETLSPYEMEDLQLAAGDFPIRVHDV